MIAFNAALYLQEVLAKGTKAWRNYLMFNLEGSGGFRMPEVVEVAVAVGGVGLSVGGVGEEGRWLAGFIMVLGGGRGGQSRGFPWL